MERLNIRAVAAEAFHRYRLNFVDLLKVGILPALAYAAVLFVWRPTVEMTALVDRIVYLVMWLIALVAGLSCHRVILLGPGSVPRLGVNGSQMRDWTFVGAGMLLCFISYGLRTVVDNFAYEPIQALVVERVGRPSLIVAILLWLVQLYVLSRLSIHLPAISIDRTLRPLAAWRLSRRNGLQLLLLIGLPPWAFCFVQQTISGLFDANATSLFVESALFWVLFPLQIALLSVSYQKLSEPSPRHAAHASNHAR